MSQLQEEREEELEVEEPLFRRHSTCAVYGRNLGGRDGGFTL